MVFRHPTAIPGFVDLICPTDGLITFVFPPHISLRIYDQGWETLTSGSVRVIHQSMQFLYVDMDKGQGDGLIGALYIPGIGMRQLDQTTESIPLGTTLLVYENAGAEYGLIRMKPEGIPISSCYRKGGWTEWSSWSSCRNSQQRRRRSCSRPSPIGLNPLCSGPRSESRPCLSSIPEYFWGQWSPWNEWSDCDCRTSTKSRTRQCMGRSCEGCGQDTVHCFKDCPIIRKHSEWTNWIDTDSQETRYRCLTTSSDLSARSELEEESRVTTKESVWTDWEIRRGVAVRLPLHRFFRGSSRNKTQLESIALYQYVVPSLFFYILLGTPVADSQETRYRCLTTSSNLSTRSELEEESRVATKESVWTDWEIRRGVTLRYRNSYCLSPSPSPISQALDSFPTVLYLCSREITKSDG